MPDIRKRLEKAEKYVQKGKLDDALAEYLQAFREDPKNDSLVEIIAELYLRKKQIPQALECYQYLFEKSVEQNNGPAAVLMFRKMSRLGSQDPAHMLVCARFLEKQKPAEARDYYRLCAKQFQEKGDRAKALEALRGLATVDTNNPETHFQMGEMAEGLGQNELASQAFARASELLRAGQPGGDSRDRALSLLERAHALLPSDTRITLGLANACLESGNPARTAELLKPLPAKTVPERNRPLAEAYLTTGRFADAEELLWNIAAEFPEAYAFLWRVLEGYLGVPRMDAALNLLERLKQAMFAARKEKEFVGLVEGLEQKNLAGIEVLEFLAWVYKELSREPMFSQTLARVFDLCMEAGKYQQAAGVLERLGEAKPDQPENKERLGRLAGKLDDATYRALAARVEHRGPPPGAPAGLELPPELGLEQAAGPAGGPALEDMISQAELLVVVGQMDQAVEYLKEIARLYPGAESRNDRLRSLLEDAGMAVKPVAAAPAPAPQAAPAPRPAATLEEEEAGADIARISEITRLFHRQGTAKGILSTCVNEIGTTWQVSRCLASLCTPGQAPAAVLEYSAPGTKQSEAQAVLKLVTALMELTADGNPLEVEDSAKHAQIAPPAQALEIKSLLALPLIDADQPTGVVVLQQCDRKRRWSPSETVALKSIVDQMARAISHVKLRSLMKAVADETSGLLNRSSYLDCLVSESVRAQKQKTTLSVALLQFGKGKQTFQQWGEDSIRQFMQAAAQALIAQLRQNDVGVRYDTTTLAVVLPGTKGKDSVVVVDKIRKAASAIRIGERPGPPLIAGIAEALCHHEMDPVDSVTELINRLEAALEAARAEGVASKLLLPPS